MEATQRRRVDAHIAALTKGYARGRQVSCRAAAATSEGVSARCSVAYCGRDICLTLVYSLQRRGPYAAEEAHWQVDVCPDTASFADLAVSPYSLLSVDDLERCWNIDDPASSVKVLDTFLDRLSRDMRQQLVAIDNPR